jgi:hypothetical protein
MTHNSLIAILAVALIAAPAGAQLAKGAGQRLKETEVKNALLGVDLQGFSPTYQMSWRECIDPAGETLYETPDQVLKGRLFINPEGLACFAYEDTGYSTASCFSVYRQGKGIRFESDVKTVTGEPDSVFVTTKLVTGVKSCKPQSLVS